MEYIHLLTSGPEVRLHELKAQMEEKPYWEAESTSPPEHRYYA